MGGIHIYTEEERREARNDTFYEVVGGRLLEVGSREYSELCTKGSAA